METVQVETFGSESAPDLAFVLGWGNRPDHATVRWLIDALAETYRVHALAIPTNPAEFEREYLRPVREYVVDLGSYRLLGHSTGGLVGEYLRNPAPETRTYLSPWWGFHESQRGPLLSVVSRLPVRRPLFSTGVDGRRALGELATDRQIEATPSRVSPAFLGAIRRAHEDLPPFEDGVVFYSPDDVVVSPAAIERRVPERRRVAYEGGHELFSSPGREEHLPDLRAAIAEGVAGVE